MTPDPSRPEGRSAVIVAACRTPIGRYGGALATVRPDDLAALVVGEAVRRAGVDPALVEDARAQGARVLIDAAGSEALIVGVVLTARPVVIDREGDIRATARRIVLSASREVLAKTAAAFVQVKDDEVEVYGTRVITRAREVAKVLARMISLN